MYDQSLPQMGGQQQVVMMTPTQAELDAAAEVKRQEFLSGNSVKIDENVGEVMPVATVIAEETIVRLSKNQKLRMAHKGFDELESTWKTASSYEEVADGSTTVYRYVAPGEVGVDNGDEVVEGQARPTNARADNDDGIVITDNGTFTKVEGYIGKDWEDNDIGPFESYQYDGNASSSSANDGLVGPNVTSMAAEYAMDLIVDTPGKIGGADMSESNYLTIPGRSVRTSWTHIALIAMIGQIADGTVVKTELTIDDLLDAGVPATMLVSDNLTDYQDDIAATGVATAVDTIQKISQIVHDAN